ncbi:MAG: winged helix-turn-helix domain-containing protein [Pyrinomonadaceae bacterium]|nr:winged helix-turn-helix domain-containing protein [Pyrinomonadaceae bacterium]
MIVKTNRFYRFNGFQLEVDERLLKQGAEIIPITSKAFDILIVLLENRGKIVEKETLLNRVWADTFISEATLAQNILTLRRILGKGTNGKKIIETVPRFGYRFIAEVSEISNNDIVQTERHLNEETNREPKLIYGEAPGVEKRETSIDSHRKNSSNPFLQFISTTIGQNKLTFTILIILISIGGIFGAWQFLLNSSTMASHQFEKIQLTKLTVNGKIARVAISPSGKYLSYVETNGEENTLFLKQIATETLIKLVATRSSIIGITFSPNEDYIYFVSHLKNESLPTAAKKTLSKIPMLGGIPNQIAENIDSPVAFSADYRQMVFVRNSFTENESALIIANPDGKNERKLTTRQFRERFMTDGLSWSPDGKSIVCPVRTNKNGQFFMEALVVNAENGEQKSLTEKKWNWVGQTTWLKDGSGVIFPAYGEHSQTLTDEIWLVSFPSGESRQITNGISGYFGLGSTADSNQLVTIKSDLLTNLWTAPIENPGQGKKINQKLAESSLLNLGISWTSDGKILYSSEQNGNIDVWSMDTDGTDQKQITSEPSAEFVPQLSSDGKYLVFLSNREGKLDVWRSKADGSEMLRLSNAKNVTSPSISPDGKWVFYSASTENSLTPFVWKVSIDGGEPIQINSTQTYKPQISPDGNSIVCYYPSAAQPRILQLTILSAQDGKVIKQFSDTEIQVIPDLSPSIVWTPDSKTVLLTKEKNGVLNIWRQDLIETSPKQMTNSDESIFRFALSPDGKKLIYEKGVQVNDIVLIKDLLARP